MEKIKLELGNLLTLFFLTFRVYLLHLALLFTFLGMIIFMTVLGTIETSKFIPVTLGLVKSFYYSGTMLGISSFKWHFIFFCICCAFVFIKKNEL